MDKATMHMLEEEVRGGKTKRINQYIAAIAAAIGAVAAGTILAWTSPAIIQLAAPVNQTLSNSTVSVVNNIAANGTFLSNNASLVNTINSANATDLQLSTKEVSLVSSVLAIGAALGALPVGMMTQRLGRRVTILALAVPYLINWLLTIFANGAVMLIAARFFAGLATGGTCVAAPMYIGEIAETSIRGALGAFFQLFLTIGILFTFVVGGYTTWRVLSMICAIFPILLVLVFWWMPETPPFLLAANRRRDAERSLRWLRGPDADISPELEAMQKEIDEAARDRAGITSMVTNKASRNALICSLGLMFFQQFSGINAVIFYTESIFKAAGSEIDSAIATIIVGVVQTIATFVSSLLIERAGRRILLLQSCIIMGICLVVLGVYFRMQSQGVDVKSFGWLPLLCLVLFIISFSLGFGPIPWMMMAELFPAEFRGAASGIAVIFNWVLVFIVTLCFPILRDSIGIYNAFWIFAGFMLACVFFTFFLIPETKGKTNAQIQAILAGKK